MLQFFLLLAVTNAACSERKPIVLVPGLMCSVLNIETNIPDSVSYTDIPRTCNRHMAEQLFWKNMTMFATEPRCVLKFLKQHYNSATDHLDTVEGVNFKPPQFGKVYACKNLKPDGKLDKEEYMTGLINKLEGYGYQDGVDLFCAAYDWRNGMQTLDTFIKDTTALIKDIYKSTGKKVTILSHSYGGYASKALFDKFTDYATYIEQWISSGTPWAGAFKTIGTMTYGTDDFNVSSDLVRDMTQSIEANYQLLPNNYYGTKNLMKVKGVNYNIDNIEDMLNNFNDYGYKVYKKLTVDFSNMPNIPRYCTVSNGIETPESVEYADWTLKNPIITYGDGDGTVNYHSLTVCEKLGFEMTNLGKYSHTGLLSEDVFVDFLIKKTCPA